LEDNTFCQAGAGQRLYQAGWDDDWLSRVGG